MGHVTRRFRFVIGVLALLALISLPTIRNDRNPGSAFTPSIALAGGSPDETLNPKKSDASQPGSIGFEGASRFTTRDARGSSFRGSDHKVLRQWEIYYRVFRIFAQRLI